MLGQSRWGRNRAKESGFLNRPDKGWSWLGLGGFISSHSDVQAHPIIPPTTETGLVTPHTHSPGLTVVLSLQYTSLWIHTQPIRGLSFQRTRDKWGLETPSRRCLKKRRDLILILWSWVPSALTLENVTGRLMWRERRPGTWVFVETLCRGRGILYSAPWMASGQFGCGRKKNMRLAPARRLHSTSRCLHAKLGSSWTMRPVLSPSTTSLTMAHSSTPSQNVPSRDPCGLSSILVSMMAEETRPLWPSVLWGWHDREPLTVDGSLWTLTPPLLTPPPQPLILSYFPMTSELPLSLQRCRDTSKPGLTRRSLNIYVKWSSTSVFLP